MHRHPSEARRKLGSALSVGYLSKLFNCTAPCLSGQLTEVFTGAVDRVDLYRDPGGAEWVNEMTRQHDLHGLELIVL